MRRVEWESVSDEVRDAIEARTGPVLRAETATEGLNSEIALFLHTHDATIFVKGLRGDRPGALTQHREAAINPYVRPVAPLLRWQLETDGWHLLAFDHVKGRHADYAPGTGDLPKVIGVMRVLERIPCADLPVLKRAESRWAEHVDDAASLDLLAGDSLLHTDYNPLNVLIGEESAHLVDWAWPTRGAAWIDPACLVLRLIVAGHPPAGAEAWAARTSAWGTASDRALGIFAAASVRLWTQIASGDPQPWKARMRGRRWPGPPIGERHRPTAEVGARRHDVPAQHR
jgi:hypothetical protein